jgi:hypothetical protein
MICSIKRAYTKKDAQRVKNRLRRQGRIVRIYACRCGYWHLTHVPLFERCLPNYLKARNKRYKL